MKRLITVFIALSFITNCLGHRTATPVSVEEITDSAMTCESLNISIREADAGTDALQRAEESKEGLNWVMIGIGLPVFWPALFFMDASNDEKIELKALQERKEHLKVIYLEKCTKE